MENWPSVCALILGLVVGCLDFSVANSIRNEGLRHRARFFAYLVFGMAVGFTMGWPSYGAAAIGVFVGSVLFFGIKGRGWLAAMWAGIPPAALVALMGSAFTHFR